MYQDDAGDAPHKGAIGCCSDWQQTRVLNCDDDSLMKLALLATRSRINTLCARWGSVMIDNFGFLSATTWASSARKYNISFLFTVTLQNSAEWPGRRDIMHAYMHACLCCRGSNDCKHQRSIEVWRLTMRGWNKGCRHRTGVRSEPAYSPSIVTTNTFDDMDIIACAFFAFLHPRGRSHTAQASSIKKQQTLLLHTTKANHMRDESNHMRYFLTQENDFANDSERRYWMWNILKQASGD